MLLSTCRAYDLLARYGVFAREACDKCGVLLYVPSGTRSGASPGFGVRGIAGEILSGQRSAKAAGRANTGLAKSAD
jgi:hypothetical protein